MENAGRMVKIMCNGKELAPVLLALIPLAIMAIGAAVVFVKSMWDATK